MKIREQLPLFIVLFLSLLLRFFALENIPGVLGDEGWGFAQVQLFQKGLDYTFTVPSGRLFNPIYGIVPFLTHATDPFGMRLPSVIIGLATLSLAFYLFKKLFGEGKAILITLLIACFPPHIHYSRLAWDCCLIPVFSLLLTYFILQKKLIPFFVAMVPAFTVHPSLALLIIPGMLVYDEDKKIPRRVLYPSLFVLLLVSISYVVWKGVPLYIPDVSSFLRYLYGLFDFLAGTIVSQDTSDVRIPLVVGLNVLMVSALFFFGLKKLTSVEKRFFLGMALSLMALYLVRGVWPALPGHERSLLFAGSPLMLIVFLLLQKLKHAQNLTLLLSGLYLAITFLFYFDPAITKGGQGLQTRSGPQEPKYAAAEWIVKNHTSQGDIHIIAEDWGIFWNAYNHVLGNRDGKVFMKRMTDQPGFSPESALRSPDEFRSQMNEGAYAIGFRGGIIDRIIRQEIENGVNYSRVGFKDYSGEDFIYVWVKER